MEWQKPSPAEVWRAVEVYVKHAYAGAAPSTSTQSRLDSLRLADADTFYAGSLLERDASEPAPRKYSLRLGNRFYPHMKLVIEATPDSAGHMFRADTHDKHIRPAPDSKEYALFCQLMENNQKLSESIESAWEEAGLPTFKQYLRDDLARRAAAAARSGV
jgi:hypothetical protein